MNLDALSGNRRVKEVLDRQEQGRGLSHAYLLSGPKGSGRHTLARLLAAAMLCTGEGLGKPCGSCASCRRVSERIHPDVKYEPAEGDKPLSVDQVRELRRDAYIRPNQGARKIYVLDKADRMNASAQNAMLKLLEEGPPYAVFLLLAGNPGGLLQTVRSRCEALALTPAAPDRDAGNAPEQLVLVKELAGALERAGELELLGTAMALDGKRGEELSAFLSALESELGDRAVRGGNRRRLLRAVELVRELKTAARLNVSGGPLTGWLCAQMFDAL